MSARDRIVLLVICAVAAIVAPWVLVIQPKRDQAAKLNNQVNGVQSQLNSARAQLAQGNAARAAFASSYATVVRLGEAVPTDDNTPSLIYQLQGAAKATNVDFQALTFNAASGGASSAPATTASAPSAPSAQSAQSAQSAPSLPPGATIGSAGFPVEPFTFTFQGNFFHLGDFLGRLQHFVVASNQRLSVSGRLMTLDAITLGPAGSGFPQMTATISATTYLLPASQGLLNGATPAGPASSSTQTVSTSTSSGGSAPAVISTPTVR
jgi:Type II secretion system (T2SS), protein M